MTILNTTSLSRSARSKAGLIPAALAGFVICFSAPAAEPVAAPEADVGIGGGGFARYLHLDLRPWRDGSGERLKRQDLLYYGGRFSACGPLDTGSLRWRLGGLIGLAGHSGDDDIGEIDLSLITAGLNTGLSWRPGRLGISLDLTVGGGAMNTEIKRAELERDWDLYERRTVALFYWEPLISFDWEMLQNFVVRLQAGYSFLYGKGKEVGGFTGGLACDLGRWM